MTICKNWPVCAILRPQINKQAASVQSTPTRPIVNNERGLRMLMLNPTTRRAWWQDTYVSCYVFLSCFCCIIEGVTTSYKTGRRRADNTRTPLTIATYLGGARL